jgi:hypothetical protein
VPPSFAGVTPQVQAEDITRTAIVSERASMALLTTLSPLRR